jgi:GNAT superfamily N-acetyltransferase
VGRDDQEADGTAGVALSAEETMIEIRVAMEDDIPALVALADSLVREDAGQRDPFANLDWVRDEGADRYRRQVSDEDAACFVAVAEDEPIGYVSGRLEPPNLYRLANGAVLGSLYVRPGYRNRGVGERLVDAFLAWVRTKGVDRVMVTAFASNHGALRFYERVGFAPHDVILQYTFDQNS